MNSDRFLPKLAILALTPMIFTGCATRTIPAAALLLAGAHITGKIHGGEQPVVGATIQLFDAEQGGDPLIMSPTVSDADGNFSITGEWSQGWCNGPSDQLYLVATGGNPGSGVNDNLVLMAAVGQCGDLTPSSTVTINEVTTVATIAAFNNFFSPFNALPNSIIAGAYIYGGDVPEYTHFLALVDPATGVAVAGANQQMVNALANSISPCVNQASQSGDTPQCDAIINASGPDWGSAGVPQDPAVAVYSVINSPTYNPAAVFNFAPSSPPFAPTLVAAPSSWTIN